MPKYRKERGMILKKKSAIGVRIKWWGTMGWGTVEGGEVVRARGTLARWRGYEVMEIIGRSGRVR
jgi:hypothetical protein